ncbi:MAG TPA: hypothetical protein ENI27_03380 [bacterium]|nr:hypothetical protein [bacterium]
MSDHKNNSRVWVYIAAVASVAAFSLNPFLTLIAERVVAMIDDRHLQDWMLVCVVLIPYLSVAALFLFCSYKWVTLRFKITEEDRVKVLAENRQSEKKRNQIKRANKQAFGEEKTTPETKDFERISDTLSAKGLEMLIYIENKEEGYQETDLDSIWQDKYERRSLYERDLKLILDESLVELTCHHPVGRQGPAWIECIAITPKGAKFLMWSIET